METNELLELANLIKIGGVPTALIVFLIVQTAKWVGLARSENQIIAWNVIVSVVCGATYVAYTLFPPIAPYVNLTVTALISSLSSALLYKVGKTLVQQFAKVGK